MKILPIILSFAALTSVSSSAATIAWSSSLYTNTGGSLNIMGVDQFSQTGTQIFAVNVNGPAMSMTQSSDPAIAFTASSADLDTSALTLNYAGYFANAGGNNDIIRSGSYVGGGAQTVTLNNLTVGNTYAMQALVADGRGGQTGRKVSFDGIDQGQYANGVSGSTWGPSLLVTGTFVADAASQSFTVQAFQCKWFECRFSTKCRALA